jgi:hypothetical protein
VCENNDKEMTQSGLQPSLVSYIFKNKSVYQGLKYKLKFQHDKLNFKKSRVKSSTTKHKIPKINLNSLYET